MHFISSPYEETQEAAEKREKDKEEKKQSVDRICKNATTVQELLSKFDLLAQQDTNTSTATTNQQPHMQ